MSYTLIHNWGWTKHEDCRNAYSVHASDCRIALAAETNQRKNKIQYFESGFATVDVAKAEAMSNASERFADALAQFGFKQMLKVCKCTKVGA